MDRTLLVAESLLIAVDEVKCMELRRRLYHMTHVSNLLGILRCGQIICKSKNKNKYVSIAYEDVQYRRSLKQIPIPPYGTVHDYVPFYFAVRPPMLYVISKGGVETYNGGQEPIVYLCLTVDRILKTKRPYVFSDGNASSEHTLFFNDISSLEERVDFEIMEHLYWTNNKEYPDRRRKRQAEFLVKDAVPWSVVEEIGVMNENMKGIVTMILERWNDPTPVTVRRDWYY